MFNPISNSGQAMHKFCAIYGEVLNDIVGAYGIETLDFQTLDADV